jgi:hypothetical protein
LLVHAKVLAMVLDELVNFLEAALVEKQRDPLVRGEFSLRVIAGAPFLAAARLRFRMAPAEFYESLLTSHPEPERKYSRD